ncbi:hypothetical protein GCM10008094_01590 [Aidingimonas halophila]|nr:hypothetical protein GCM10008094_01590 [Aidingimonas halophila]
MKYLIDLRANLPIEFDDHLIYQPFIHPGSGLVVIQQFRNERRDAMLGHIIAIIGGRHARLRHYLIKEGVFDFSVR